MTKMFIVSDAAQEEIRASYKRLALRWHPDKHNNSPEATTVRNILVY